MKKALSLMLATATTLTLFAGCAGKPAETSSAAAAGSSAAATPATQEAVTISFWDGNWNEEVFKEVKALWDAEHPNIKLEAEFHVDKGMSDKYMLALQNKTAPDVVACALDWTTTFGSAGMLAPLDEFVKRDNLDVSQYVQGALKASTVNGNLYALPFRSETYGLFYNKDILAAAGFDKAPETWEEVKTIAAACNKDGVAGYGTCGTNYGNFSFQYISMLRCSGGSILTEDNTKSAMDSEVALQTAQLYKDLSAFAPTSLMENDNIANRTLFASGKVAMYLSGIYDLPEIIKANPELNVGCAMVPTANGAERETILGGWSVGIAESSKNKDAAWEFVKFITRPDVAAIYTNTFTGTGDPAVRFAEIDKTLIQPHADALAFAQALPSVQSIVGIRQAIFDNLVLTLTDSATVSDAMGKLNEKVNALLAG